MNSFKIITILLFTTGISVLVVKTRSVESRDEISESGVDRKASPKLIKQEIVETKSDPVPSAELTHKRISRKFANMDRIVLGDQPHVDSRASRRITENRMLTVVDLKKGLNVRSRVTQMRSLSALSFEL